MQKIKSIFIIDDDPITVFGIRKILENHIDFNQIATFKNGKLALERILKTKCHIPEVIFLDLNMPIICGWQFLDEFIKLPIKEKVRVNIITSSIDPTDLAEWENYKKKTHHLLTYNYKPLTRKILIEITKPA